MVTKRRKYCLIVGGTVILAIVLLFCFIPYYIRSHFLLSENEVLAGLEARYGMEFEVQDAVSYTHLTLPTTERV